MEVAPEGAEGSILSHVLAHMTAPSAEGAFWGPRLRARRGSILSHVLAHMTAPSAEGAFWGPRLRTRRRFRLCGGEAGDGARLAAFRLPPPPLRGTHL